MVKHTQTIRRQLPTNCLTVFDHFMNLALKGLIISYPSRSSLEACEKPSNIQQIQKPKCFICGKTQNNGMNEKFRIFTSSNLHAR